MESQTRLPVNASALQDFLNCPRRFQLRYLLQQPWPAVTSEPASLHEQHRERGVVFHRLLQRLYQGIDAKRLDPLITDPLLRQWWNAHQQNAPVLPGGEQCLFAEKMFRVSLDSFTLTAFIDLVVISQDTTATIIDWKTTNLRPDAGAWKNKIQTSVYLYVLGETVHQLASAAIPLANIRMMYWFAQYPHESVVISYSDTAHAQARQRIVDVLGEVGALLTSTADGEWPKTSDFKHCAWCEYRSLCNRGAVAQTNESFDDSDDLDWQQENGAS